MGRGGAQKNRDNGAERKCLATGTSCPKSDLIRFVVGPNEEIVPDIAGKLPGRGLYVTAQKASLRKAVDKNLFARGAKKQVSVPAELVSKVEQQLARRVVDLIALSRKSGSAVAGYEKVKAMLQMEEAQVLIQAVDGSGRGKSKLSTPHFGHYIGWLTADELGMAFGRQTVIHGALASGGLTKRVVEEAGRLRGFREEISGDDRRLKG